jgi:hypothetical protein
VPVVHDSLALASLHATPQPPQSVSVVSGRSQPLPLAPSQFPKPGSHVPSVQAPLAHDSVAFVRSHGALQAPQSVSVFTGRSQPLLLTMSQLAKSGSHVVIEHVPLAHDSLALTRPHVTPQPPQSARLFSCVSQPLPVVPSQLPQPGSHVVRTHAPLMHVSPARERSHAVPQPPQSVSVVSGLSQPLATIPSQLPNPPLHVVSAQLPLAHDSEALFRSQLVPQPPQFESVRMSVSQPLTGLPSQSAQPVSHARSTHAPDVQVSLA